MRRILLALMSTLAAVVLLFGYRTSTAHPALTTTTTAAAGPAGPGHTTGGGPTAPVPSSSPSRRPATASTPAATTSRAASSTYTGDTAQTRWGPVQVRVTVTGGRVAAVDLLQVPSGNPRDAEINAQAVPILTEETIRAQSAQIDAVSGATVTSDGYTTSLQSALDRAGL